MLNFLSSWIEGIAVAVIVASIFEMILPNGNIKKYVKMILGVYVVFSIISPFVDSEALYSLNVADEIEEYAKNVINSTSAKQEEVTNNLNDMYIEVFENEISSEVEKQGYTVESCKINANFNSENEELGINEIYIKLKFKNNDIDEDELKEYLSDQFELDKKIIKIE